MLPSLPLDRGMEEAESDAEKEVPNRGDATNQMTMVLPWMGTVGTWMLCVFFWQKHVIMG